MASINDEPTLVDLLDRAEFVREVGDEIATCQPPQVFGVHGDWGLGKTSFLQQVQWYLTGDCPQQTEDQLSAVANRHRLAKGKHRRVVTVVWFDAWRYQDDDAPVVALLQEIRSQLDWYVKLGRRASKTAEVAVRGALLSMEDLTKKIGIQTSKIQAAGERWEREHFATALPSHTMRDQLKAAIDQLLPRGRKQRLVVLIDDLDRCEPLAAYRLLEGLKIYLTVRNCVFVLGMNQKILEGAIGENVPSGDGGNAGTERAAAYLEKLCQNVWRLPSVRNPKKLLCEFLPDADVKRCIGEAIGELHCLPPNPRRIKGLANLIQRVWSRQDPQFLNRDNSELIHEAKLILVVASVYQFHHDLFLHWEANPELYHPLLEWVRGFGSPPPVIERLRGPYVIKTDERTTTPEYDMTSSYPDPTGSNVFWVQPLIHELGEDARIEDFARYLHGAR